MSKKYPGSEPPMEIGPYDPDSEISVPVPDLEAENARLQNLLTLMTAERDGLGSKLLDVQQDSIRGREITRLAAKTGIKLISERDRYKARDKLRGEVLEELVLFFQSGNEVPVTRAVINANSEWVAKARAAIAATPDEALKRTKDD